jgi:surfactin synthase thioesterase subunit
MKNFWLILLIFVFPLQAALAAVEAYHGHVSEIEVGIETVLHSHADHDHEHGHESSLKQESSDKTSNSPCEGDHHHCHAHSVTVLPSFSNFDFPISALAQRIEQHKGFQSHLSNRIERPKWA